MKHTLKKSRPPELDSLSDEFNTYNATEAKGKSIVAILFFNSKIEFYSSAKQAESMFGKGAAKGNDGLFGYSYPNRKYGIYLRRGMYDHQVAFHEFAHATGPILKRKTYSNTRCEECLANAVTLRLCDLFDLPRPDKNEHHYINFPPEKANKKEVRKALNFIIKNWLSERFE